MKASNCTYCDNTIDYKQLKRVYGSQSPVYLHGFCSASCYTKYSIANPIIPQTDNTRTIEVNVYDAKVFLGQIQSQIDFFEQIVDRPNEAKHWKTLLESANELLNVNSK